MRYRLVPNRQGFDCLNYHILIIYQQIRPHFSQQKSSNLQSNGLEIETMVHLCG